MTMLAERPIDIAPKLESPLPIDLSAYEEFSGRMRFTRDTCDFLERVGILSERYELIDGEIIVKVGQNLPHSVTISEIVYYLMGIWGPKRVLNQTTMEVRSSDQAINRPEPDIYVLDRPASEFKSQPQGSETLLAVEVSDSTLRDDLLKKASLYARSGVPEFWVADINGRKLYVHRQPIAGTYTEVVVVGEDETIAPLAAPANSVRVGDLLPPLAPAE